MANPLSILGVEVALQNRDGDGLVLPLTASTRGTTALSATHDERSHDSGDEPASGVLTDLSLITARTHPNTEDNHAIQS